MIPRTRHHISAIDERSEDDYEHDTIEERYTVVMKDFANVISSRVVGTDEPGDGDDPAHVEWKHAPVLDLDFPAVLIPSSTPGHFHLYLDKPMEWSKYETLLHALADAGVIERGYANASIARRATFVRDPESHKPRYVFCPQATAHDPHLWIPDDGLEAECIGNDEHPF